MYSESSTIAAIAQITEHCSQGLVEALQARKQE